MEPRTARVAVLAALLVLTLTGCGGPIKNTLYADGEIRGHLRSLAKPWNEPLARSLTWKYHQVVKVGRDRKEHFVVDGELVKSASDLQKVSLLAALPVTSGTRMEEVYRERAREADRAGNRAQANMYNALSGSALNARMANERFAAGLALGSAIQDLGGALGAVTVSVRPANTARYLVEVRPPIISPNAPGGSVLELFFSLHSEYGGEAKPADQLVRWQTVATLKDAQGKVWRSAAAYSMYALESRGSEVRPAPPEFRERGYLLMDMANFLPADDQPKDYLRELQELGKMAQLEGFPQLGVAARHAIDGLYEQIEMSRRQR